jgi:flavin-dependent dehydrogenase
MKVVIAGAGVGGMIVAERLGQIGFEVVVYEKAESLDTMRYDWHDDVSPVVFDELGINLPKESAPKRSWTFCSPYEKTIREFSQDESCPDMSVERRPLNRLLFERASKVATFVFGKAVTAPVVENNRVVGVMVDGKRVDCDLVVDSAGVYSPVRRNLPRSFGISEIERGEVFEAYRAFYNRAHNSATPKYTNKVYMKHLGENGISWTILDHNPTQVNVLVGLVGGLSDEVKNKSIDFMREHNDILGDTVLRGGYNVIIPVRYPATKMVADGYVAIGDSAYMTIPLLGSGIASSMWAGDILAKTIKANVDKGVVDSHLFDKENLWQYQVGIYKKFGAKHLGVDVLKRWLLTQSNEMVDWLFASKVLSNADLQKVASGNLVTITPSAAIEKVMGVGLGNLPVLLKMNSMVMKSHKANRLGNKIPKTYSPSKINKWEQKVKALYK